MLMLIVPQQALGQDKIPTIGEAVPYPMIDDNGVSISTGGASIEGFPIRIGNPSSGGIDYTPTIAGWSAVSPLNSCHQFGASDACFTNGFIWSSNLAGTLSVGGPKYGTQTGTAVVVSVGGVAARFSTPNANNLTYFTEYSPVRGRTLVYSNSAPSSPYGSERVSLTDFDGTVYEFLYDTTWRGSACLNCARNFPIHRIIKPNGDEIRYEYHVGSDRNNNNYPVYYLRHVSTNRGFAAKFVEGVTMFNQSVDYCPIESLTCSFSRNWPSMSGSYDGKSKTFRYNDGRSIFVIFSDLYNAVDGQKVYDTRIVWPNGRQDSYTFDTIYSAGPGTPRGCQSLASIGAMQMACPYEHVLAVTKDVYQWTYAPTFSGRSAAQGGRFLVLNIKRRDSAGRTVTTEAIPSGSVISRTDESGNTSIYEAEMPFGVNEGRLTRAYMPEGNSIAYEYDSRGNVTKVTKFPKPGSGQQAIVNMASYPLSCANIITCNRPTSITDGRGAKKYYTYDEGHGGVLTETAPPGADGIVPVRRLSYVQRYAWIRNGGGGFVRVSSPVWLLSQERTCHTSATQGGTCAAGAGDEVVTSYEYGPDDGSTGNNLLLRGVAVTTGGQTRRTCYGYDVLGNRISEMKPRAGLGACP